MKNEVKSCDVLIGRAHDRVSKIYPHGIASQRAPYVCYEDLPPRTSQSESSICVFSIKRTYTLRAR